MEKELEELLEFYISKISMNESSIINTTSILLILNKECLYSFHLKDLVHRMIKSTLYVLRKLENIDVSLSVSMFRIQLLKSLSKNY